MRWRSLAAAALLVAGVQNLLHGDSLEYADRTSRAVPSPIRISPYGEASWRF